MRIRILTPWLLAGSAAVAMATAIKAPAEVLKDLDFFRDLEMIMSLELLEDEGSGLRGVAVSTSPAAAPAILVSTAAVNVSTSAGRGYGKN